jgi:glyoxylase-like metal-dependent hydrolase (beta-lactamase superfamily II)
MKVLHKSNLYCWSQFDEDRNIDFHSYLWVREQGNVIFDPLPLTAHDEKHLVSLGKVSHIIISNSDHVRNAKELSERTGAQIWGPTAEKESFPIECSKWLSESKGLIEGLDVYSLNGSKTDGELAFVVEGETLITGDLIRAHSGGNLCMLPTPKLKNLDEAINSVKKIAMIKGIKAILPGDGWPIFRNGETIMSELVESISK